MAHELRREAPHFSVHSLGKREEVLSQMGCCPTCNVRPRRREWRPMQVLWHTLLSEVMQSHTSPNTQRKWLPSQMPLWVPAPLHSRCL